VGRILNLIVVFALCGFLNFAGIQIPSAAAQTTLAVDSVRIGTYPEKTRLVFELSNRVEFRSFSLNNPARIVVDFPSFDWNVPSSQSLAGGSITNIRHGVLQPGISRIVIDLKQNADIKSAFILPRGPSVSDRLVIDFTPTNAITASQRIFGNLNAAPIAFGSTQAESKNTPPAQTQKPVVKQTEENTDEPAPQPKAHSGYKPTIVIDPGHGGKDPGAIGGDKQEKNVTLAAAKELKAQLEATGRYRVHLTRSNDVFIKLQDRVKIARKHGADLFVSLHADSIDKPGVRGASIYTLSNKASDAQTAKLAARENQADLIAGVDLSHEDKEVANILIDLAMRDTMNQSKFFANTVVKKANARGIELLDQPHRFAGFAVLKAPDIPSVLVEMGFMSNKQEANQLSSPEYRKKIMGSLAQGIEAYFQKVQKNGQN
jgi:N-acetylmuramoyl-L-alanine amidase